MHELSLAGQVQDSRHLQVLKILAGVAAMPPEKHDERRSIYKPKMRPPQTVASIGARQEVQTKDLSGNVRRDLFHLQLVEASSGPGAEERQERSYIEFYDVPEAGQRPVTSRFMSTVDVRAGDPRGFMAALGYHIVSEYLLSGDRFFHEDITLFLYRIWAMRPLAEDGTGTDSRADFRSDSPRPGAVLLGDSEDWILSASVRVKDGKKMASMQEATDQLLRFKEIMGGIINMRVPERLSLDTRVK